MEKGEHQVREEWWVELRGGEREDVIDKSCCIDGERKEMRRRGRRRGRGGRREANLE